MSYIYEKCFNKNILVGYIELHDAVFRNDLTYLQLLIKQVQILREKIADNIHHLMLL